MIHSERKMVQMMAMAFAAGTAAGCLAGMVTVGLLSANKLNDAYTEGYLAGRKSVQHSEG